MSRWLAAIALLPALCSAQQHLYAGAEWIDPSGPAGGSSQSLAWIHASPDRGVFVAGATRFELEDTRWTLARLAYARPVSERLRADFVLEAGPARSAGERFNYRRLRAGLDYRISPALSLAVTDTYLNIRPSTGHLLGADLIWRARPRLQLKAGLVESLGDRLDATALALRADYHGRVHFFLGAADGRTSETRLLNLPGAGGPVRDYRQVYVGLNVPLGATTVSLALDFIDAGPVRRRALSVGFKLPLTRGGGR